jgi:regulator of nucleoside diphosphate kinase
MMTREAITMTNADIEKLRELLREAARTKYRNSTYLHLLEAELDRAIRVNADQIPPGVITMNSTATLLDMESGEEMKLTLVYPEEADLLADKISVLAPVGSAMLGYREGDSFTWESPTGERAMRVLKVKHQPSAEKEKA